jgi:hypothetical protein
MPLLVLLRPGYMVLWKLPCIGDGTRTSPQFCTVTETLCCCTLPELSYPLIMTV